MRDRDSGQDIYLIMHETSLIEFTLNAVESRALSMDIGRVTAIHLVIGELRGALPDLMERAFVFLSGKRPLFHGCRLDIKTVPAVLRCRNCGKEYGIEHLYGAECPGCGSPEYEIVSGNELLIDSFDAE